MGKLTQTNRTILFERFNPEKLDLLTIIGETDLQSSLSDDKIEEINEKLVVKSFDEFLLKFDPTIYSYFDTSQNKICYSLEKNFNLPQEIVTEIKINKENTFFKMLLSLMDARNNNKVKTVNFNYEDILELLSPRRVIENLKQTRKEINYLFNKYELLDNENPEKKELGDKLNYCFLEASKNYNNVLAMLPLAIEDIEVKLSLNTSNSSLNKLELIKPGLLYIGETGSLEIAEISTNSNLLQISDNQNNEKLTQIFKDDYNENVTYRSEYVSNLVARSYVPNNIVQEIDIKKEVINYNSYLTLYKNSQEDFIEVAKELIKKVLGVKVYFDQYDTKSIQMKPQLLISNFKIDLLANPKKKEALGIYFNTVNNKNDFTNTIWFGILPNVNFEIELEENKKIKKRFLSSEDDKKDERNKFSNILNLADLLEKYKIQLFFNFHANDKTDFKTLAINGVESYKIKTKILENKSYSEYLIPVLPNFTIIPKNRSKVLVGKTKGEDIKDLYYYINGLYLDASYVAAGLISAYQCPGYLKDRFRNVNNSTPGVRINIESDENSFEIKTTMPKEISGYTIDVKNKINEENYGFIFASENAIYKGKPIENITVYKARSLFHNNSYSYEPIYKTLTSSYIERIMRYETTDFKEDRINYFFSASPNSIKSIWEKDCDYVNAILRAEDDLTHTIISNTCSLNLSFAGDVKHLNLLINSMD